MILTIANNNKINIYLKIKYLLSITISIHTVPYIASEKYKYFKEACSF